MVLSYTELNHLGITHNDVSLSIQTSYCIWPWKTIDEDWCGVGVGGMGVGLKLWSHLTVMNVVDRSGG